MALKTTFLLGGNPDPESWDEGPGEIAEACFAAAEEHDLVFHFHTSPGGASDLNNFIPLVERYGKRVKIYLVHFGGGVSGHIQLVPRFLDWVEQGYKVYADITWTVGFGARWLLTEIERRGVGADRVLFASDEPWSDFWGEYYKIDGQPVGKELKDRILHAELRGALWTQVGSTRSSPGAGPLIADVQSLGLRVEAPMEEGRRGGAGPADAGMIWVEGIPVTVPARQRRSPPVAVRASARPARRLGRVPRRPATGERHAAGAGRASTTSRPTTASRTGRSRCSIWTRWPAP